MTAVEFEDDWQKAQAAALKWGPSTTNQSPDFIRSLRNAYCYGFLAALQAERTARQVGDGR
jgi:hypothetical protein